MDKEIDAIFDAIKNQVGDMTQPRRGWLDKIRKWWWDLRYGEKSPQHPLTRQAELPRTKTGWKPPVPSSIGLGQRARDFGSGFMSGWGGYDNPATTESFYVRLVDYKEVTDLFDNMEMNLNEQNQTLAHVDQMIDHYKNKLKQLIYSIVSRIPTAKSIKPPTTATPVAVPPDDTGDEPSPDEESEFDKVHAGDEEETVPQISPSDDGTPIALADDEPEPHGTPSGGKPKPATSPDEEPEEAEEPAPEEAPTPAAPAPTPAAPAPTPAAPTPTPAAPTPAAKPEEEEYDLYPMKPGTQEPNFESPIMDKQINRWLSPDNQLTKADDKKTVWKKAVLAGMNRINKEAGREEYSAEDADQFSKDPEDLAAKFFIKELMKKPLETGTGVPTNEPIENAGESLESIRKKLLDPEITSQEDFIKFIEKDDPVLADRYRGAVGTPDAYGYIDFDPTKPYPTKDEEKRIIKSRTNVLKQFDKHNSTLPAWAKDWDSTRKLNRGK